VLDPWATGIVRSAASTDMQRIANSSVLGADGWRQHSEIKTLNHVLAATITGPLSAAAASGYESGSKHQCGTMSPARHPDFIQPGRPGRAMTGYEGSPVRSDHDMPGVRL
jgi:hypothetical protein